MSQDNSNPTQYSSLTEIRLRKELLQKDIEADDARIKALWKSLFSKPDALSKNASPSKECRVCSPSVLALSMVLCWLGNFIENSKKHKKRVTAVTHSLLTLNLIL